MILFPPPPPPVYVEVQGVTLLVAPQPSDYPSPFAGFVTQFAEAQGLAFIAHEDKAGKYYSDLLPGTLIVVGYKDHQDYYRVDHVDRYQAVQSLNPAGDLVDLQTGRRHDAEDVFHREYGDPEVLVLQTCIGKGANTTWGRLFVVAKPFTFRPEVVNGKN